MIAGWFERAATPPDEALLGGVEREFSGAKPRRGRVWRGSLAGGLALAAIIGLFHAQDLRRAAESETGEAPLLASAFHRKDDLPPLMTLRKLDGRDANYEARLRESDGERQDTITVGAPQSDQAFFRATAHVMGSEAQSADLFVELAREAAAMGLAINRASAAQPYASARGQLLISDLIVEGAARRDCIGFRLASDGRVDISGMACGAAGKPIERQTLDCFLERLRATPAGVAKGLDKALGSEPAERSACSR
ncbi:MAG TPA: hypothetical protein VKS78_09340 [Roseiarcus sp.]|nr:hypothetical protein [Roseiarcus sp.]